MQGKLILTDELFIGKGMHKAVYTHPFDATKCIKVPFKLPDTDVDRELKYRAVLNKKKKKLTMLTEYYGTVDTNKGIGYIYERVCDYDGKTSLALKDLFADHNLTQKHLGVSEFEMLKQFKEQWERECVVTSDTDYVNYFAQKLSKDKYVIRIIDNVGTPSKFPLAYMFEYFAKKRAQKYWKRLVDTYIKNYAAPADREIAKQLY